MTDDPVPTVRSRFAAAGVSEEPLLGHFERGTIRLDDELVRDLDAPAPAGTRIVIAGQ